MIILAIDQSFTGTGIAVFRDRELMKYFQITSNPENSKMMRQRFIESLITKTIKNLMHQTKTLMVGSEGLAYGAVGKNKIDLAKLLGGIQTRVADLLPLDRIFEVPPTSWKKLLTGSGRADKKEVIKAINEKFGLDFIMKHNNLADAIGIGWYLAEKIANDQIDEVAQLSKS